MAGRNSQQSRILHSAGGTIGTFDEIEAVTAINGPDGSAAQIDVTDLRSLAKEFLAGLADYGQLTLAGNWIGGTKQGDLFDMFSTNADPQAFKVAFPTTSQATHFDVLAFDGAITQCTFGVTVDDKQTFNVTIRTSGQVTLTQDVALASLA